MTATPDDVGRIIICQPSAACTCPAVAWQCRGNCKGAVAAQDHDDRQTRSTPGPTVDKPDLTIGATYSRLLARAAGDVVAVAVLDLHSPDEDHGHGYAECCGCDLGSYPTDRPDWPCETVKVVSGVLGFPWDAIRGELSNPEIGAS